MYYVNGGTAGFRLTGDTAPRRGGAPPAGGGRGARGAERVPRPDAEQGRPLHLLRDAQQHRRRLQPDVARLADRRARSRDRPHVHEDERRSGSGMRPELSPDGKWLAYATRNDAETSLMLRDLATGDEHFCFRRSSATIRSRAPNRDVVPTYSFTPDSKSIIIGHHGHFWRADVADRQGDDDPVHGRRRPDDRRPARKETYAINDTTLTVHQIRDVDAVARQQAARVHALDRAVDDGSPERHAEASRAVGETSASSSPRGRPTDSTSPTSRGMTSTAARCRACAPTAAGGRSG